MYTHVHVSHGIYAYNNLYIIHTDTNTEKYMDTMESNGEVTRSRHGWPAARAYKSFSAKPDGRRMPCCFEQTRHCDDDRCWIQGPDPVSTAPMYCMHTYTFTCTYIHTQHFWCFCVYIHIILILIVIIIIINININTNILLFAVQRLDISTIC